MLLKYSMVFKSLSKLEVASMKKWIKVKMMFLAQLREDEHYSMCVKPNERSSGLFSVSIRCMACGKAIMLQQKMRQPIYVVSNW